MPLRLPLAALIVEVDTFGQIKVMFPMLFRRFRLVSGGEQHCQTTACETPCAPTVTVSRAFHRETLGYDGDEGVLKKRTRRNQQN